MVITNAQIKYIKSLSDKKERYSNRVFVAEGVKVVNELLLSPLKPRIIYALKSWDKRLATQKQIPVVEILPEQLKRISTLTTPNEVLALVDMPPATSIVKPELLNENLLIVDTINDPGNLGTLIRTAHWFGIRTIIASQQTVDCYNQKVIQSSMGSFIYVNVVYTSLQEFIAKLNMPIYAADLKGKSIYTMSVQTPFALLLGSESHGINNQLLNYCKPITIPSFTKETRSPESLNVSVAGAIILSKFIGR